MHVPWDGVTGTCEKFRLAGMGAVWNVMQQRLEREFGARFWKDSVQGYDVFRF